MSVFVLGSDSKPLMPCIEKRARLLLERGRAVVVRIKPFVIKLKDRSQNDCILQDLSVKVDPGSKTTGIAVTRPINKVEHIKSLYELEHRGQAIKMKLIARAMYRRNRRSRNTRYRPARFLNRKKPEGWLAPSLMHRVITAINWIKRLMSWCPVTKLYVERVKFDTQKLMDTEITGIEYQQGTLHEFEVKEYLLEKWGRKCAYCGTENGYFEKEHIVPRARGGGNRVSNLTIACHLCNQKKAAQSIEEFLVNKPEILKNILAYAKKPLLHAAAVNSTRNRLLLEMQQLGLPIETGTGAQTKFNRTTYGVPKTHALDAICVGDIAGVVYQTTKSNEYHTQVKCTGRGRYCRTRTNKYGNPIAYARREKRVFGFQTGDLVRASIHIGMKVFKDVIGRIVVKSTGFFTMKVDRKFYSVPYHRCKLLQKADGYEYGRCNYTFMKIEDRLVTCGLV